MPSLLQELPEKIKRLEAKHGPNNPFVQQLKEQLRAMQENGDQSTHDVFRMQAFEFKPEERTPEDVDEKADGEHRIAKFMRGNPEKMRETLEKVRKLDK